MLLSIQLELITTKMEKDRQYFEIKNNFKNSFYKKYINLCKKVKHNTLYLTNLSDKEEKKRGEYFPDNKYFSIYR